MCGYCKAMTAGEAEHFYESIAKGTMTKAPDTVFGHAAPRADLRTRQAEELEMGAFEDAPHFREDLQRLCRDFGTPAWNAYVEKAFRNNHVDSMKANFEWALVTLRQFHDRPVWSDHEVEQAIAQARTQVGVVDDEAFDRHLAAALDEEFMSV